MYTSEDEKEARALAQKRLWLAALPGAAVILAGIVLFVAGRMNRSETMWIWTAALTVLGGAYILFMYGVWVKPARVYQRHVSYMLNGRMRETVGVLTSFADAVSDRDGLWCHAMMINIGRGDPEDDRLFYYDAHKPRPDMPIGTRVRVLSNDKMVSLIQPV